MTEYIVNMRVMFLKEGKILTTTWADHRFSACMSKSPSYVYFDDAIFVFVKGLDATRLYRYHRDLITYEQRIIKEQQLELDILLGLKEPVPLWRNAREQEPD